MEWGGGCWLEWGGGCLLDYAARADISAVTRSVLIGLTPYCQTHDPLLLIVILLLLYSCFARFFAHADGIDVDT